MPNEAYVYVYICIYVCMFYVYVYTCSTSSFSVTLPMPPIFRVGRGLMKSWTSLLDGPISNWPSGFLTSAAILARKWLFAMPAEHVSPHVAIFILYKQYLFRK